MLRDHLTVRRSIYQGNSYVVTRTYTQITRIRLLLDHLDHSISSEQVSFHEEASKEHCGSSLSTTSG